MKLSLLRSESSNRAIASSMIMSLLAKVLTLLQSQVISYSFGTTRSTDILFSTLSIILMFTAFINAVNQSVMIPNAINIRNNISEDESKKFICYIYFIYAAIGLVCTALIMINPVGFFGLTMRFDKADLIANVNIIRFIVPTFFLIIMNTFMLDIFTSYRYFTFPMMLDMLKNVVIIAFVLCFKGYFSVTSLAIGVFTGNVIQFIVLNFLLLKVLKIKPRFNYYKLSSQAKANMMYTLTGQVTKFGVSWLIANILSGYDEGVFSAQDYSNKIYTVFSMVVITQIGTVIGMNFIDIYSKKEYKKLNDMFLKFFTNSIFIIAPICAILFLNADNIISILFERGQFTRENSILAGGFFKYLIIGVPLLLVDGFVVRLIIAKQIQKISFMWQMYSNIMTIIFIWIFTKLIGFYGYPIALAVSNLIYVITLLLFLVRKQFDFIDYKKVLSFLISTLVVNAVLILLSLGILNLIDFEWSFLSHIIKLAVTSIIYLGAYLLVGILIKPYRELIISLYSYIKTIINKRLISKNVSITQ